jgi:hypothetical protein
MRALLINWHCQTIQYEMEYGSRELCGAHLLDPHGTHQFELFSVAAHQTGGIARFYGDMPCSWILLLMGITEFLCLVSIVRAVSVCVAAAKQCSF